MRGSVAIPAAQQTIPLDQLREGPSAGTRQLAVGGDGVRARVTKRGLLRYARKHGGALYLRASGDCSQTRFERAKGRSLLAQRLQYAGTLYQLEVRAIHGD